MDKQTEIFTCSETEESLTLADLQLINQLMAQAKIETTGDYHRAGSVWAKIQSAIGAHNDR